MDSARRIWEASNPWDTALAQATLAGREAALAYINTLVFFIVNFQHGILVLGKIIAKEAEMNPKKSLYKFS